MYNLINLNLNLKKFYAYIISFKNFYKFKFKFKKYLKKNISKYIYIIL